MVKQLMTGVEIRAKAADRLKKHRDVMAKNGYKTVSVFMGEPLRGELDLLSESQGMTRHVALEHIFEVYQKSVNEANIQKARIDSGLGVSGGYKSITSNDDKSVASNDKNQARDTEILDEFILDRHKRGGRGGNLGLKEIANALMDARIKTATGLDTWKPGTVDSAFKAAIKRQKEKV